MKKAVDPYKLLEVSPNFTLEDLRNNYKRIALTVHPDKPGGSEYMFKLVTECYKTLVNELKLKQADKQYTELKSSFQDYLGQQSNYQYQNTQYTPQRSQEVKPNGGSRFDVTRFNKVFEDNREKDIHDEGYTRWMESQDVLEPPKLKNNISNDKFNSYFERYAEQQTDPRHKVLVKYKEPEALLMTKKIGFTELGQDQIDDFSGENKSLKNLNYMDYKLAHTTTRIVDPSSVKRKDFNNLQEIERERANIKQLSSKELAYIEKKKLQEEAKEKKRQETQYKMDMKSAEQFQKLHRLMLSQQMSKY
jgi:curved DNA-binding protein CbpA